MYSRHINPLKTNSFFLFGARGTGKSTLIRTLFANEKLFELDLLDPSNYEQATFALPELSARFEAVIKDHQWIFIDEVQKAPRLLDVVQRLIDKFEAKFILTGSSARKLKRGGANLLAGRAYTYNLYPLVYNEIKDDFDLDRYLAFGGLPRVWGISDPKERGLYLKSYITTYLKEEIAEEQIVRRLEPFGRFLQVAGQSSGTIINYSNIARDVGVSDQTVRTYFQILEDTLLAFTLPTFETSIRKSQKKTAKFYLFDTGVLRALNRSIDTPLTESNYAYGKLFEHFLISQIIRELEYLGHDFKCSYLNTSNNQEIDLIIERAGKRNIAIEIKSAKKTKKQDADILNRLGGDMKNTDLFLLSRDPEEKIYESVRCLPWQKIFDLL